MVNLNHELKRSLPEMINGSPWYHYVDPAIDATQLAEVSNILNDEFTFLSKLFAEPEESEQEQVVEKSRIDTEESDQFVTQEGGASSTESAQNSLNCMADNSSIYFHCENDKLHQEPEPAQPLLV